MAQSLTLPSYMTGDHNMRASKVIGMPVYNEHGDKIGVIDDITLPASGGEVSAVLSVGGLSRRCTEAGEGAVEPCAAHDRKADDAG